MIYTTYYKSKIGNIKICASEKYLLLLSFIDTIDFKINNNAITDLTCQQLDLYFNGKLKTFNLQIAFDSKSNEFYKNVWSILKTIEYGQTISYKQIGEKINSKAYRLIGKACAANNIAIIIPCHRVIVSNNKLTGYAYGLERKAALLELEKKLSVTK